MSSCSNIPIAGVLRRTEEVDKENMINLKMINKNIAVAFLLSVSFTASAQTRLTVLLGGEGSSFGFYREPAGDIIHSSNYTRWPVLTIGLVMEKSLEYRWGLQVEGLVSARNKVDIVNIGIITYDYIGFNHFRLSLHGVYHLGKSFEISAGPSLNYNHKFYRGFDEKGRFTSSFSSGRVRLGLSGRINWVLQKHFVIGIYGIYGTDWLFKDQVSNIMPFNTFGVQLGYRF
jgi:hypothetical protein